MKSYQFLTDDGRGGTMLCNDKDLATAVSELTQRFKGVVRVQLGEEVWRINDAEIVPAKEVTE